LDFKEEDTNLSLTLGGLDLQKFKRHGYTNKNVSSMCKKRQNKNAKSPSYHRWQL